MLFPQSEREERFTQIARSLIPIFRERAARHDREGSFPHENFADIRRSGLPALVIPETYGGWGATLPEAARTMEILAAGDGSTALSFVMHVQVMGSAAASRSWPDALFERLSREAVERGALVNAVATEPRLGSPSRGGLPETSATPVYADGDEREISGWIINGRKSFASLSPELDYFIVPAALEDGSGHVARFVVPASDAIEIIETWDAFGMRSTGSHDIRLVDAYVGAENMIGRGEAGFRDPAEATANAWFVVTVCAVYLGVAQAAVDFTADFARKRVPTALGKPIAELESIQRRLGGAELLLTQARALLYSVAEKWHTSEEEREALSPLIVSAKVTATNHAIDAVDECMRVVGGASMSRSLPLERYLRDVRPGLFHPVSDDQALPMLGRRALERVAASQGEPDSTVNGRG